LGYIDLGLEERFVPVEEVRAQAQRNLGPETTQ